jgi:hypothetical protein
VKWDIVAENTNNGRDSFRMTGDNGEGVIHEINL